MKIRFAKQLAIALICGSFLISTSTFAADNAKSSEYYEQALNAFNEDKFEDAYIHLKNSLQADSDNLPAKILMGRVLMVSGYLEEAEAEFQEALIAGADANLVIDPLGKTWLFLGKEEDIVDAQFRNLNAENTVNWRIIQATANLNLKNVDQARNQYKQALRLDSDNTRILNALSSLESNTGRMDVAQEYLTRSFTADPNNANTWRLQGELNLKQNEVDKAVTALEKGYSIAKEDPLLNRSLVSAYLKNEDGEKAKKLLEEILAQTPDDPTASLLNAWLLAREGNNTDEANDNLQTISSNIAGLTEQHLNSKPELLYIAALSAFAQRKYEQAHTLFVQYLNLVPQNIDAIKLLAQTQVKLNKHKLALEVMQRQERELAKELDSALLLGNLYISNNKAFKALEILYRLKQEYPDNKRVQLLEIKTLISREKYDEALAALNASPHIRTDLNFILSKSMLLLEMNRLEQATQVADQLLKAMPENPDFINYKAAVLIKRKKWSEAEPLIRRVLNNNPTHYSARFNMASVLSARGEFDDANAIVEQLYKELPDNLSAKIMLARTQVELGQNDAAMENLERVLERDIDNTIAMELLLKLHLQKGETDKAARMANELVKASPDVASYHLQRAELFLLRKQPQRAIRELNKITKMVENSPRDLVYHSRLAMRLGETELAKQSIVKASVLDPDNLDLADEYVRTHVQNDDFDTAWEKTRALKAAHPENPRVLLLEGDLHVAQQNPEPAAALYMQAYKRDLTYRLALAKLYQLTQRNVGVGAFDKKISALVEQYPDNYFQRSLLADFYINTRQTDKALMHYLELLKIEQLPNRVFILNNMANIYLDTDINKAKQYAEQAMSMGIVQAAVLDTHGWIKALTGEHNEALDILRRAHAMDSEDPAVRYHLAYTLVKLGRAEEAKQELLQALSSDKAFEERNDAQTLLESI